MFRSLLIANRGEIACRIMRTCRRLGIESIAVYSDADAEALHVRMADRRVRIGAAPARASYLNAAAIVDAAQASRAEAVHPGYGFLSEREELVAQCMASGIGWVGPSLACIRAMGSKIEAKRIARKAGVVGVPGYDGADQSDRRFEHEAEAIGYPLLIKASAGGGGKGMRLVALRSELFDALALARREAEAAFGDGTLLIETYIARPRHLEVQLAGDRHGNLVHLFERECSIQRKYQKLIEEAPAAHLSEDLRERLYDAALRLGRAIRYDSLGTVEFILDADGMQEPYFLEMNTRLQVEHPVTEEITGLDLVEWQIRIAAGENLPLGQKEIARRGWAIEARVNAEDPASDFMPQAGTILRWRPDGSDSVRIDSGIAEGSVVSSHYDSLLAKVVAHGPDRTTAARRLARALRRTEILGLLHNQDFLADVLESEDFEREPLTTRFLAEHFEGGWSPTPPPDDLFAAAASALMPETSLTGFRSTPRPGRSLFRATWRTETRPIALCRGLGAPAAIREPGSRNVHLFALGKAWTFEVTSELEALAEMAGGAAIAGGGEIRAPMPGIISTLQVEVGQAVLQGQTLAVLEAMKLLHGIAAPRDGVIEAIFCAEGAAVSGRQILFRLKLEEAEE